MDRLAILECRALFKSFSGKSLFRRQGGRGVAEMRKGVPLQPDRHNTIATSSNSTHMLGIYYEYVTIYLH